VAQDPDLLDLVIVGGGVNGAGIARDAVGRGLKAALFERDDLAGHTSSRSTKLIHGGLRYLENFEFRLVREALQERRVLLGIAPHIMWPLRFVMPHAPHVRPAWMIRLGLILYDSLAGRGGLPSSKAIRLPGSAAGAPLKPQFTRGFVYSDGWVDDARLVVLNAVDAAERGAHIHTRTEVISARRDGGLWRLQVQAQGQASREVRARALVNAAGPWVQAMRAQAAGGAQGPGVRLVKGSHLVVPKLYEGEHAYILQNPDRRIVFAIPYEGAFTLIGTTDEVYEGDPREVAISPAEAAYLCDSVSAYFARPVSPQDVVWSYAGVRPLYEDHASNASKVTRDYVLHLDHGPGAAPMLSIYGGKITTYRRLAEHALQKLLPCLPDMAPKASMSWTGREPLPGGDVAADVLITELQRYFPFLGEALAGRLAHAYGSRALRFLGQARTLADLGESFGAGLTEAEVRYLMASEWARTAEDILWRRTKLGLHMTQEERAGLADWMERQAMAGAES
jgi:glycerol-3-phosphate dehydrogenase